MGIAVVVADAINTLLASWALKERSTGHNLLDYTEALRLTLSKASEHNWRRIKVQASSPKLRKLLRTKKAKDTR